MTQADGYEGAICPECEGTGEVRVIVGDEEGADPCPSCGGSGHLDLRLVDEPEDQPSFANHADEIAWHLSQQVNKLTTMAAEQAAWIDAQELAGVRNLRTT
ncbi:MAG: hypothetical protein ACR652_24620 [Methylocystis sp.]|uniref:hypothetical protein n=1 Tax=Methylocystis sp. TaxID=1911079 RepID=UPI003DA55D66